MTMVNLLMSGTLELIPKEKKYLNAVYDGNASKNTSPGNTSRGSKTNDWHPFLSNIYLCFDSLKRPFFLSIVIVSWMFINVLNELVCKTKTFETLAGVSSVLPFTLQIKIQREGLLSSYPAPLNSVI